MDKVNLDDSLKATIAELQEYLELQLKYNKILLAKKMGEILSHLALFVIIVGTTGFLLIFLSFAFAEWFNEQFALPYAGHLIVAGFYMLMLIVVIAFKRTLIFNPIRKLLGNIVFGDGETDSIYEEAFKTPASLEVQLRTYRELIKQKGDHLGEKIEKLSKQFTITNILQTVARNLYTSYITTSNIMRTAYSLVKRITSSRKQKVKKRKKGNPSEEEE